MEHINDIEATFSRQTLWKPSYERLGLHESITVKTKKQPQRLL